MTADAHRRPPTESGAALVEAAVVTPVVVLALVALVVTSVLWRDHLAAADAVAAGARMASLHPGATPEPTSGSPAPARGTPQVVAAVAGALGGVSLAAVERLVLFGVGDVAGPATTSIPPGCRDGSGPGVGERCVVLGPEALADPAALPGCSPGACRWRDEPGISAVGVFVRLRHPRPLGGVVPPPTIEAVSIAPLEGGRRG